MSVVKWGIPLVIEDNDLDSNANNTPFVIRLNPTKIRRTNNKVGAVWVQEDVESAIQRKALLKGLVFVYLVRMKVDDEYRTRFKRAMEVLGHEAEVQAEALFYGGNEATARLREATSLKRSSSYAGLFDNLTVDEIVELMLTVRKEARELAANRAEFVRELKEEYGS